MADDKNTNQDPEEDKFDDDEDFGLPDLEYEELGDDDDFEDEMETVDEVPDTVDDAFEVPDIKDEVEPVVETPEEEPATPEDMETTGLESELEDIDLGDIDTEISDEELQKEIEKMESEDVTTGEGDPEFYEEESFEEFNQKDDPLTSVFGADEGTPEPVVDESKFAHNPYDDRTAAYSEGSPSDRKNFTKIVIIGSVVITLIAVLFIIMHDPETEAAEERASVEQPVVTEPEPVVEEPVEDLAVANQAAEEATPQFGSTSSSSRPAGEVSTLETKTGKSYVIVGSFFDGDLAMDRAKKLASEGESPMIIPPFNNYRFYRVAIAEYDTFNGAINGLGGYQGKYGSEIWALRY